ncbi:hypothetical protein G5B40_19120 [Pikeienuella piscinae]|uniref:Uncharacterized protein n=1 Tax=Pikeienuella piscinae TaxID=2748098 RepID=A0A7M3T5T5_9RHOB|nr:hypothetical protein [Pikeienuella piscinae]QIE57366.1 hypothetical protein G5B40_19120 [Pikeienuella piscinae]
MKPASLAVLFALAAGPVSAGELFSGTHTYRPDYEQWNPVPAAGWWTATMVGEYEAVSGPIPAGRIECRGGGYWNKSIREANGVCVFGEASDTWMLRYRATEIDRASRTTAGYMPIGEWTVLAGTGRYNGMTGSGTYLAEGAVAEGGKYRTRWEGEVTIP